MPCTPVDFGNGDWAIVCTRGGKQLAPCEELGCSAPHVALCDYRLASGKTCDRRMCARHRHPVGPNRDHCGPHHRHPEAPLATTERRIPLAGARRLADQVLAALAPGCERIEVAGSIRRERPDIGDIEIVAAPRFVEGPRVDMFAPPPLVSALDPILAELAQAGRIGPHPTKPANGPKYKRLWLVKAGVQLDLFLVLPPAEWGPIFTIRTGPADYSQAAVTELRRQGLQCESGRILRGNETVPCPDEETFFRLAGLPFLSPSARGR